MELNGMGFGGCCQHQAECPMPSPVAVPFLGRADLAHNPQHQPNIQPQPPDPELTTLPSPLESGPIRYPSHRPTSTYSQKWYQPYQWHSGDQWATCSRKRRGRAQTPEGYILVWRKLVSARTEEFTGHHETLTSHDPGRPKGCQLEAEDLVTNRRVSAIPTAHLRPYLGRYLGR